MLNVFKRYFVFLIVFSIVLSVHSMAWGNDDCSMKANARNNPYETYFELDGNNGKALFLGYTNYDINCVNDNIDNIVVTTHGTNRAGLLHYKEMMDAALKHSDSTENTLVVSLKFFECHRGTCDLQGDEPEKLLYWSNDKWRWGAYSTKKQKFRKSSFRVLDMIVDQLTDGNSFPNVEKITITGHSGGGQFAQRYAAANRIDQVVQDRGIEIQYLPMNPKSYVYLNHNRCLKPNGDSCDQFGFKFDSCFFTYNNYGYGLNRPYHYVKTTGTSQIQKQYPGRSVVYFVGENDNKPQTGCNLTKQGESRYQRAAFYKDFMDEYYPSNRHGLAVVPGVGHDFTGMYQSDASQCLIFGKVCERLNDDSIEY